MVFKMKGSSLYGRGNQSKSSAAKMYDKAAPMKLKGSFIDGERATYADAEAAAAKGGNVTHTNAEAQKKADSQGKTDSDQLKQGAYKGPGGKEQKAFDKAKSDDRRAQDSIETRSRNKKKDEGRKSRGNPTLADKDGYRGGEKKRNEDFDKKNSKIKTEKSKKPLTEDDYQGVKGASKTVNSKGAKIKNDGGTKSTKDYDRESKKKKMQELKNK